MHAENWRGKMIHKCPNIVKSAELGCSLATDRWIHHGWLVGWMDTWITRSEVGLS